MDKNYIIAGFPGVGKTSASQKVGIYDAESSGFKWEWKDGKKISNPEWPLNYIKAIMDVNDHSSGSVIMTSTHTEVLRSLLEHTNVIAVIPTKEQLNDYLQRYLKRGSPMEFIRLMSEKWYSFLQCVEHLEGIESDHGYTLTIIRLQPGQYLADILPR